MATVDCPYHGCDGEFEADWDDLGEVVQCPRCLGRMSIEFEETWDGEEEHCWWEEYCWWYAEKA